MRAGGNREATEAEWHEAQPGVHTASHPFHSWGAHPGHPVLPRHLPSPKSLSASPWCHLWTTHRNSHTNGVALANSSSQNTKAK